VRTGFGQRRKTLRRSLIDLTTEDDFVAAGIDPGARAEQLDVAAWGRLALAVHDREAAPR
jgi:16S rRNA (adenine1518-N6/adenine1519-N6)-dimethyltransferase